MTITGAQVKAARELLGWTLLGLGYRAHVSEPTSQPLKGLGGLCGPIKCKPFSAPSNLPASAEENGEGRASD